MKTNHYKQYVNNYESEVVKQSVKKLNKRFIPKRADYFLNNRNEPNFRCNKCNTYFTMNYGRFGKFSCFEESTYYCLDCSNNNKFIKM